MKSIPEAVVAYRQMEQIAPNSSMLREVRWQYADMAAGGDGGFGNGSKSIREEYYSSMPDEFFQEVRDLMGWSRD